MAKKGSDRELCIKLSLWRTKGRKKDIFRRTTGSGARFTSRMKKGEATKYEGGDITYADPIGERLISIWNIEGKSGYNTKTSKDRIPKFWDLLDIIDSKRTKPQLISFWEQTIRDAKLTKREPILIFRRNNRSFVIVFKSRTFSELINFYGYPCCNMFRIKLLKERLVFVSLSDFFEWIPDISVYEKWKGEQNGLSD